MEFRIADTFTASLARLTGDEQKLAKTTAFDLQVDPTGNGHSFHKLDKARDSNFWSVRVSRDIRLIVHKTGGSLLLCYVDHHDRAYQWAERRKLETHPATGAAQLVEIRELVREISVPEYAAQANPASATLFGKYSDKQLLAYGVPPEWLLDVRAADEDSLLELVAHLPSEAAEALLELATGGIPVAPKPAEKTEDPFQHPDAQRRFRVMSDTDELARALEYPWDKWTVFLHPAQRQMVERDYSGPARVSGSAGTGKTVVALHRAVQLARTDEDARILLSTFSDTLANVLRSNLYRLAYNTPKLAERIDVAAMDAVGAKLYSAEFGKPTFASREEILSLLKSAARDIDGLSGNTSFLLSEWDDVFDTWQLESWVEYRDAKRLGRKTRLPEAQRALYWQAFAKVKEHLRQTGKITTAEMFGKLAEVMPKRSHPVFDYIIVDEAQDIGVQQLRFLASIASGRPNALFFSGDLGQRIFQQPFSWKSLGVDVRGRARTLTINYRTSHQIRSQADRLLGPEVSDVDGNLETRKGTISVFNGPEPVIRSFDGADLESQAVGQWLKESGTGGVLPHEIGVFVRSEEEFPRARAAIEASGLKARVLGKDMATEEGFVSITTMHLAKGMEFRVVAVMACDEDIIPSQRRIDMASDDAELTEIYNTERHLLYVACTRARDLLHVSAIKPGSEFLQDLMQR
ncbi:MULTISPECIES: UvrD-helicase domain-containing protein [Burkholderia]|uniref:UvrD-helicase domain-containing protein n=1 Tax=Burkholderia TaxID=32008 RepID=UPI000975CC96|nr:MULTISPECIES: UvrD-helicase domain-containing protein [pseudomallei group]MCS3400806.1 UvrD-helicase domain-containing protein [Burkholderia thailandensis]ONE84272.1 DNA helicase [Burkholderia pseudomallei]QIO13413.1 ATP-dependent helicase [Burkholderia thailandensis]CAJ3291742.1 superfamily I DNA/RNA helicase-like protein [Burkholderia pseudomallei]CAJ9426350.1 superfamily I DNA/RNA helicase-like protein [Burkholderia pseudomallei]